MFTPHSQNEKIKMLKAIGVDSFQDLLTDIPPEIRLKEPLKLRGRLSELEARRYLEDLASLNLRPNEWISFLGGGAYDHYIPSVVDHIVSRSEFYTAYTPYQAEVSQGTLQTIYEFQSLIVRLTGMEIANASLYDGASALAEGVLMASHINGRKQVVVSGCIHPHRLKVLKTYLRSSGFEVKVTSWQHGRTQGDEISDLTTDATACVVVENPNFFGCVEDVEPIANAAHKHGALLISVVDPISLGLLAPPGQYGADIAVGEGQALGCPLSFGGPYLGFLATRKSYIRKIPGRIVGRTHDRHGKTCYCLTLQTREQHIRRARATSNICTNQALMALRATVYLCWLGRDGISAVANQCLAKAHYALGELEKVGVKRRFDAPFFREFVVEFPNDAREVIQQLASRKFLAGIPLSRFYPEERGALLMAFTEKRAKLEIDMFVETVKEMGVCAKKAG